MDSTYQPQNNISSSTQSALKKSHSNFNRKAHFDKSQI
jgi:hypothetical protein